LDSFYREHGMVTEKIFIICGRQRPPVRHRTRDRPQQVRQFVRDVSARRPLHAINGPVLVSVPCSVPTKSPRERLPWPRILDDPAHQRNFFERDGRGIHYPSPLICCQSIYKHWNMYGDLESLNWITGQEPANHLLLKLCI